jgi:Mn2+/Fe2+ NRAMP family transporter
MIKVIQSLHTPAQRVILLSVTKSPKPIKNSRIKRVIGAVAVVLIVTFTILAILGIIIFAEWILAEIIIALIANIIFRTINRRSNK